MRVDPYPIVQNEVVYTEGVLDQDSSMPVKYQITFRVVQR